ncbi:MAG: hypothetical protein NC334_09165, partial [Bacteroides sp.]|nr:hypothetical protein [Bacteroides sp.]
AKLIIGTALTLGAAYLCKKAYNKGAGEGIGEKIWDGMKKMCSSSKDKLNSVKDKIMSPKVFSVTEENGKTLCTIPGRTNRLTGEKAIQELGIINEVPVISTKTKDGATKLAEGIKIRKGTITVDGHTFNVKNGKIINSPINLEQADSATRDRVHDLLKKLNNGETANGIKIEEFLHTDKGTTRVFTNKDGVYDLRLAVSDKHNINSSVVKQYRGNNEKVDNALKEYLVNGNKDGLKIASAEIPTAYGTLITQNGKTVGIKVDGNILKKGTTEYDALFYDHKKEFETAIKNTDSYQNVIYQMA